MSKYTAKVELSQGEAKEVMLGLSITASDRAEKISISRDVILNTLKMASSEISKLEEDTKFIISRKTSDRINFKETFARTDGTECKLVDFMTEKIAKSDLNKALLPFIKQGQWDTVITALENKFGVWFDSHERSMIEAQLQDPQVDLNAYLKQVCVPKTDISIIGVVSKKGKISTYIDVITVARGSNLRFAEEESTVLIRLSEIA